MDSHIQAEDRVIALYGNTCVGKTTIASALARLLGAPVRFCGEELKRKAASFGTVPEKSPDSLYHHVDLETISWVGAGSHPKVVEGRFLDVVLEGIPGIEFFELTCSPAIRTSRFASLGRATDHLHSIDEVDTEDSRRRETIYKRGSPTRSALGGVSTDHRQSMEVAEQILRQLGLR